MAAFTALPQQTPQQLLQLQSFWNLIQASDEAVQFGLYAMLEDKYAKKTEEIQHMTLSFRQMKGILKSVSTPAEDFRAEYIDEKYGL